MLCTCVLLCMCVMMCCMHVVHLCVMCEEEVFMMWKVVRAIWVPKSTKSSSGGGTKPPKMAKKCKKNFVPSLLTPKKSEGEGLEFPEIS